MPFNSFALSGTPRIQKMRYWMPAFSGMTTSSIFNELPGNISRSRRR
jgi:hypothetical protein